MALANKCNAGKRDQATRRKIANDEISEQPKDLQSTKRKSNNTKKKKNEKKQQATTTNNSNAYIYKDFMETIYWSVYDCICFA